MKPRRADASTARARHRLRLGEVLPNLPRTRPGPRVVGITISREQAKQREDLCWGLPVEIRLQDYRDVKTSFLTASCRSACSITSATRITTPFSTWRAAALCSVFRGGSSQRYARTRASSGANASDRALAELSGHGDRSNHARAIDRILVARGADRAP